MEIQEIKSRLTMERVLQHYGLIPDRNQRLCCPFHNDKTPSLQVYPETNTCYCFSSNCKTHGKSLDVIDFIMYKEGTGKHEALVYAAALAGEPPIKGNQALPVPITKTADKKETNSRKEFLGKVFAYFCTALKCSSPAKAYLQSRGLDITKTEAGYNSGQLHHGTRKDDQLIADCLRYGLLLDRGVTGRNGEPAYGVFGKGCICFALRNREKEITGLYFRSITNNKEARHFYLKDRQGLYPCYPKADTKTLILTESVIDAATLIQYCHLEGAWASFLACYGTNGLTEEHMEALQGLQSLEEIIFFFDGDASGRTLAQRYGEQLKQVLGCKVSTVDCPEGEDINSLLEGHEPEVFTHLIAERKELFFSFSPETIEKQATVTPPAPQKTVLPAKVKTNNYADNELITSHPDCLLYYRGDLSFTLWGGIDIYNINRLRTTLHIRLKENAYRSFRDNVDLYSHTQSERLIRQASEKLEISPGVLSEGITALTAALETYREQKREAKRAETTERREADRETFSEAEKQAAQRFLKDKKLNEHTHDIFGRIGLVGQQDNGMLLFFIFLTRMFANPLHAIVMGSSGSGKTHLLQGVSQTVPRQHIHYTTSLSENTLYYTPKDFLKHKILLQEDLDGAYQALLPLRELMSNQSISRFSTRTNSRTGESKQIYLQVEGPVCIAGATTKEQVYEDNANRSFLIQIEDSPMQERAVLAYQGEVASGKINPQNYTRDLRLLKAAQLQLQALEVLIPFAGLLELPPFVFKKLRTQAHYLTLVKAVTLWNQYNRKRVKGEDGTVFLLSEKEDVEWANRLSRESLLRKSDELSGKARHFFESLKEIQIKEEKGNALFRSVEIRQRFRLHPMQLKRYLDELEQRNLICCKSRSRRFGNEYEILSWEDYRQLQSGLDVLEEVLRKIEREEAKKQGYDLKK